jgi:uncharacterized protein (DUF697 family)
MHDRLIFRPEAFPREVLFDQSPEMPAGEAEWGELEEERRGFAPPRGSAGARAGARAGFSARRRTPGPTRGGMRRKPQPPRPPRPPGPPGPWRRRWPYGPWLIGARGAALTGPDEGSEQMRCIQACLNAGPGAAAPASSDGPPPTDGADGADGAANGAGDQETFETMHTTNCRCRRCGSAMPISEDEEIELALELMSVSSEAELDQFLGKLFKSAWKGIKKVGAVVGKVARPLGGVLKAVAKKALPFVGGALGSFIPIPGVGTAIGSAVGGALSKALELEAGMDPEDREFEMARRFVRVAATAARQAATASPYADEEVMVNEAVAAAARQHLPQFRFGPSARVGPAPLQGRWIRRGRQIELLGA